MYSVILWCFEGEFRLHLECEEVELLFRQMS
jgi:hypothetical protein